VVVVVGCGEQLNPDFCARHPDDDRCEQSMSSVDASISGDVADVLGIDAPTCPAPYGITVTGSMSKYRVVTTPASWPAAAADCADDGANTHLVVLSDSAERVALLPHFDPFRYIGHTDRLVEGTFRAVTDEPDGYPALTTTQQPPWAGGEPAGRGDCAALVQANGELYDADCATAVTYVCECDAYANDPTNY
jgi:hypothetical protein